jgi:tRNA pseudouridine55 synthase
VNFETAVKGARGVYLRGMHFDRPEDFVEGVTLLIDKPLGWTSFDVVNKVRSTLHHALGLRKLKVGHAGTLDPLATGVLVVCTGRMTKQIDGMLAADKGYRAVIRLGAQTPSADAETEVEAWGNPAAVAALTPAAVEAALARWTGEILQRPPLFSAKKVDGRRAYTVARAGGELELPPVPVTVHRMDLAAWAPAEVKGHGVIDVTVDIACSKGTYIRSLARDVGDTLGVGGTLTALHRTASGAFTDADTWTLDALLNRIRSLARPSV